MTVQWEPDIPSLRRPILVVAFEGWFDVARGATGAVEALASEVDATRIAAIDPEPYFDFTARRPNVVLRDGERVIIWPENECRAAVLAGDGGGHDLLLLAGVEPHLRWRSFTDDLVEIGRRTGAELVITLGSLAEVVPHTRPHRVTGSTTDEVLATRLGLSRPSYQGPTGLVGVLHDRLAREALPVISLRVAVPNYVAGSPNPKAMRALLEHLQHVTGVQTTPSLMDDRAASWERQVDEAVAADAEASAFVRQLEGQVDRLLAENLPSGEDLAAEFERFLEDRRDED